MMSMKALPGILTICFKIERRNPGMNSLGKKPDNLSDTNVFVNPLFHQKTLTFFFESHVNISIYP